MGIEKDINQPKFRSEHQKAIVNLIYTFNWVTEQTRAIIEKGGVTEQQFNILRILRGAGKPISTLQIRQRMLDKMSDTSRIVDRLLLKKLVKKNVSKKDKRLVDVSITEKGQKLLANLDLYEDELDAIINNLTKKDLKLFNSLLDKIRQSD